VVVKAAGWILALGKWLIDDSRFYNGIGVDYFLGPAAMMVLSSRINPRIHRHEEAG